VNELFAFMHVHDQVHGDGKKRKQETGKSDSNVTTQRRVARIYIPLRGREMWTMPTL